MLIKIPLILAVVAWVLTVYLVVQLLGGTFESGRTCQTDCFQIVYWSALVVALAGLIFAFITKANRNHWLWISATLALIALLGIFVVMMFIGTFL